MGPQRWMVVFIAMQLIPARSIEPRHRDTQAARRLGSGGNGTGPCGDPYHSHWEYSNDQYKFVECMAVLPMILLAVIFEKMHHFLHHKVMHQTNFMRANLDIAKKQIIKEGHTPGLYLVRLFERFSEELMVLGFIAFCVWLCSRGGVFHNVVGRYDSLNPLRAYGPPTGGELLHVVEDVHMHLFIAMLIFFGTMAMAVVFVESAIQAWISHEKELRRRNYPASVDGDSTNSFVRLVLGKHVSLVSYHALREYFIRWIQAKFLKSMRARRKSSGAGINSSVTQKSTDGVKRKRSIRNFDFSTLSSSFGRDFDFATYLIVHVDEIMDEMLTIHETTWGFLAALYAIQGLLARFALEGQGDRADLVSYGFAIFANIMNLVFWVVMGMQYKKDLATESAMQETMRFVLAPHSPRKDQHSWSNWLNQDNNSGGSMDILDEIHSYQHIAEISLLRAIQAVVLFCCYFCAKFLGSVNTWSMAAATYRKVYGIPQWAKALVVVYIMVSTARILPMLICELNIMMRLPPFVDVAENHVVQAIAQERSQERYDDSGGSGDSSAGTSAGTGTGTATTTSSSQHASTGLERTADFALEELMLSRSPRPSGNKASKQRAKKSKVQPVLVTPPTPSTGERASSNGSEEGGKAPNLKETAAVIGGQRAASATSRDCSPVDEDEGGSGISRCLDLQQAL